MAEDVVAEEAAAEKSIAGIADETFTDLKDASANLEEAQKSGIKGEIDKAIQAKEKATKPAQGPSQERSFQDGQLESIHDGDQARPRL